VSGKSGERPGTVFHRPIFQTVQFCSHPRRRSQPADKKDGPANGGRSSVSQTPPDQAARRGPTRKPHPAHLHRNADCNADTRITPVVEVVAVVDVGDIDLIVVVPVAVPVCRPWIDDAQPVAVVLEARISAYHKEGKPLDAESMLRSKVAAKAGVRNAVSAITAALLPGTVVLLPVSRSMLLPGSLLDVLLGLATLRRGSGPLLHGLFLLPADGRALLRSLPWLRLGPLR
jgi:hypothetical protein